MIWYHTCKIAIPADSLARYQLRNNYINNDDVLFDIVDVVCLFECVRYVSRIVFTQAIVSFDRNVKLCTIVFVNRYIR